MEHDAEEKVERLEHEADAHRVSLERLVEELERRRHGVGPRLLKPVAIVAAIAGGLVLAALAWRGLRKRLGLSGLA